MLKKLESHLLFLFMMALSKVPLLKKTTAFRAYYMHRRLILLWFEILIKDIAKVECCKIVGRRFSTAYHFYTAVFAEKKLGGA